MDMRYGTWARTVPNDIAADVLWRVEAYRLALWAADIGWHDVTKLFGDKRTVDIAGQPFRALGSIEANIAEGYSRGSGRDRARFYEYALGSARETRGWYYKGRHILTESVSTHRIHLLTHVIRLLLAMVPDQRASGVLKEDSGGYEAGMITCSPTTEQSHEATLLLQQEVPMP